MTLRLCRIRRFPQYSTLDSARLFANLFDAPTVLRSPRHNEHQGVRTVHSSEGLKEQTMSFKRFSPFALGCMLAAMMLAAPMVLGQMTPTQTSTTAITRNIRSVPSGSKMKFRGVVIDRNGDTFTIRDRSRADYSVLITDNTS